jgi:sugar transferase (PEP-CTERM/EpsH1 system associated)
VNILYLTHRVPDRPNRGDRIRAVHLLRFLADLGDVHLGCLADEPVAPADLARLKKICARVAVAPVGRRRWPRAAWSLVRGRAATEGLFYSPALRRVIAEWARHARFDAVVVFCSSMFQYADAPELAGAPLVVDLVDVDSQKWLDYAATSHGAARQLFLLEGRRLRKLERELSARAQAVALAGEAEAALFRKLCPHARVRGVSNGVDLEYFYPRAVGGDSTTPHCLFVGALDYRANVDGLRWFCSRVWPEARRRRPDLRLRLVGRRPGAAVARLARLPGVELVGEVPDVRPYFHATEVVVAPLRIARGQQNKVLEALACGKPVLASPQALEGLAVEPGRDVLQAATSDQWAEQLARLRDDRRLREELGRNGRRYVERRHNWRECLQPFAELLAPGALVSESRCG